MWWIPDVLACLPLRDDDAAGFIPRMVSSCSGICLESLREGKDECPLFRPSNIFLKLKDLGQLSLRPNVRTIPNYTSQLLSPHTFFLFSQIVYTQKRSKCNSQMEEKKAKETYISRTSIFVFPCLCSFTTEWNKQNNNQRIAKK